MKDATLPLRFCSHLRDLLGIRGIVKAMLLQ